jgi:hypothetical protein
MTFWAQHFNTLSCWVPTILLTAPNDRVRLNMLKKFLEITGVMILPTFAFDQIKTTSSEKETLP